MNNPSNAIVVIDPQRAIAEARNRRSIVMTMRQQSVLRAGVDFGKVPGTEKDTLLKPGAERLCSAFGFNPRFETIEKIERWDTDNPLFFYRILCRLIHIETGLEVATGEGSCNSMEVKYRWRWVQEHDLPEGVSREGLLKRGGKTFEFQFAIDKAETTGKYGKPAEYWQAFKNAIAAGTAVTVQRETKRGMLPGYEIDTTVYRIPNDDVFSLVNTIDKMACKRALVAAALIGANASEFFTQDVEDMPGFGISPDGEETVSYSAAGSKDEDVVDGEFTEHTEPTQDSFAEKFPANPESAATPGALWSETRSYFDARAHFDNFVQKHSDALKGKTLGEAIAYVQEKHWNWEQARVVAFFDTARQQYEMSNADVLEALTNACGHKVSKMRDWDGGSEDVAHGALLAWFSGFVHGHVDTLAGEKGIEADVVQAAHRACDAYASQREAVSL